MRNGGGTRDSDTRSTGRRAKHSGSEQLQDRKVRSGPATVPTRDDTKADAARRRRAASR